VSCAPVSSHAGGAGTGALAVLALITEKQRAYTAEAGDDNDADRGKNDCQVERAHSSPPDIKLSVLSVLNKAGCMPVRVAAGRAGSYGLPRFAQPVLKRMAGGFYPLIIYMGTEPTLSVSLSDSVFRRCMSVMSALLGPYTVSPALYLLFEVRPIGRTICK
jgi:hypothetical protein